MIWWQMTKYDETCWHMMKYADYFTIDGPVHDIFPSIWRPFYLSTWIGCDSPRTLMQLGTETVEPLQSHFEDLRQSSIVPRSIKHARLGEIRDERWAACSPIFVARMINMISLISICDSWFILMLDGKRRYWDTGCIRFFMGRTTWLESWIFTHSGAFLKRW